jgi:hypothetical protein
VERPLAVWELLVAQAVAVLAQAQAVAVLQRFTTTLSEQAAQHLQLQLVTLAVMDIQAVAVVAQQQLQLVRLAQVERE